jgi:hypothetical protein
MKKVKKLLRKFFQCIFMFFLKISITLMSNLKKYERYLNNFKLYDLLRNELKSKILLGNIFLNCALS